MSYLTIKKRVDDQSTYLEERLKSSPDEFKCPLYEDILCGRRVLEKERSLRIITLEILLKEKERYQNYFEILLKIVKAQISTPLLIKDLLKSYLSDIKEIHSGYFFFSNQRIYFLIFLEEENWSIEDKIYEYYGELLDQFPEKEIDLRLMRLWGRDPEQLLPEGFQFW